MAVDCTSVAVNVIEAVGYQPDGVVSKTLIDKKVGTLTLFAFDAGQGLRDTDRHA